MIFRYNFGFILFFIIFWYGNLFCQTTPNLGCIKNIETLEKSASDFSIFFSGEQHFNHGNDFLQLNLFSTLVKQAGVSHLLIESGMGDAYVLNRYLTTGDTTLLDYANYYETDPFFMRKLYEFNAKLPDDKKITIDGIDYEKNKLSLLWSINDLFMKAKIVDSLSIFSPDSKLVIQSLINDGLPIFNRGIEDKLNQLLIHFGSQEKKFQSSMGLYFPLFKSMIQNYAKSKSLYGVNFKKRNAQDEIREMLLYENIIKIYRDNPTKKMFCQIGVLHICLSKQEEWWNRKSGWYSLSARLNNEISSPYRNKVCSILIIYPPISKKYYKRYYYSYGMKLTELNELISQSLPTVSTLFLMKNEIIRTTKYQYVVVNRGERLQ